MRRRRTGWVRRGDPWISIEQAASAAEWPRSQMVEAIAFGIVPAIRLNGEVCVLASAVRGIEARLCEH